MEMNDKNIEREYSELQFTFSKEMTEEETKEKIKELKNKRDKNLEEIKKAKQ